MPLLILTFFAMLGLTTAQQCTSFASLVHATTGAPSGLSTPDCSYIQANAANICSSLGSWDIINANTCYLKGPGYGCTIVQGQFSTSEVFYCQVGPASSTTASFSAVPTASASLSPSASTSITGSGSASLSGIPSFSASYSPIATSSPSASASITGSGSASQSPTVAPTLTSSGSPSVSALPTSTPAPTNTPLPTKTSTASTTASMSPSSTASATQTATFTNFRNITLTYVVDHKIEPGEASAIGLAAIFGAFSLTVCCAAFMRRRPVALALVDPRLSSALAAATPIPTPAVNGAPKERRPSTIDGKERRASTADGKERRTSTADGKERRASTIDKKHSTVGIVIRVP